MVTDHGVPGWVISAFGTEGTPTPIEGGQQRSWRVGDLVLKQIDDRREAAFIQEMLAAIQPRGFRISEPRRTTDGRWVIDGWIASSYIPNLTSGIGRWADIVAAGTAFTDRARLVCPPDAADRLAERNHRWAIADAVAFEERDVELAPRADRLVSTIHTAVMNAEHESGITEASNVLIHGDMTGNVFFDAEDVAVILDVSPYLRPPAFAAAMTLADALAWHDAQPAVVELLVANVEHFERRRITDDTAATHLARALLGRAFIFRMVAMLLSERFDQDEVLDRYEPLAAAHL